MCRRLTAPVRSGVAFFPCSLVSSGPGQGWHTVGAQLLPEIAAGSSWGTMDIADGEDGTGGPREGMKQGRGMGRARWRAGRQGGPQWLLYAHHEHIKAR